MAKNSTKLYEVPPNIMSTAKINREAPPNIMSSNKKNRSTKFSTSKSSKQLSDWRNENLTFSNIINYKDITRILSDSPGEITEFDAIRVMSPLRA